MDRRAMQDKAFALKRLAKFWLIITGVLGLIWLIIWMGADDGQQADLPLKEAPKTVKDLTLPKTIDSFDDFEGEMPKISFDAIKRDLRNYPGEFKDKSFFEKNKNKWAVEVMDVSEHQIITDYLERRKDREKFAYFRYIDNKNKERYVLIYELFSNRQMAVGATKLVDFGLPNGARTLAVSLEDYISKIDNYTREESLEEELPPVNLKETTKEVKPQPSKPKPKEKPKEEPREEPKEQVIIETPELAVPPTAKPTSDAIATFEIEGETPTNNQGNP